MGYPMYARQDLPRFIDAARQPGLENSLKMEKLSRRGIPPWEQRDWNLMTQILAGAFTFSSPLDDHIKINAVKERCWPNAGKFKTIDVQQVIMNGDAVIVTWPMVIRQQANSSGTAIILRLLERKNWRRTSVSLDPG